MSSLPPRIGAALRLLPVLLVALVAGCGLFAGPDCEEAATVVAGSGDAALTCGDLEPAIDYTEALAGRAVSDADARELRDALVDRYKDDPEATREQLAAAKSAVDALIAKTGLEAAERRSTLVYDAVNGEGALGDTADGAAEVLERTVSVWAQSDEERLALTEVDIEGWVFYGSLCREVQDGSPLRLSVADRTVIYRMLREEFDRSDRAHKIALTAFGAFWPEIKDAWQAASYEEQQAWIKAAPLPPAMVATSKGYLSTVLEGDLEEHAEIFHRQLGPFHVAVLR